MFIFPPAGSKAHRWRHGQQAALGWETSRVIFWGKHCLEQGGEQGDEVADAGDTSWQWAEPTGVADGPLPPARLPWTSRVRRPACPLTVMALQAEKSHSVATATSPAGTVVCCHLATSKGTPGMAGYLLRCPRGGWGSHPACGSDRCYPVSHEQGFL